MAPRRPKTHERSFASHPKSAHWHYEKNGGVIPRDVAKCSNEKWWFQCDKCPHDFDIRLNHVTCHDRWCPYCANQKLCDNPACQVCHEKSFASHPKSVHWHDEKNGDVKPRDVFKSAHKECWFKCDKCPHAFRASLNNATSCNDRWCPYCSNQKLCDDQACQICHAKSFASHLRAAQWNYEKNGESIPRTEFMQSHKRRWFTCDICSHDWDPQLYSVALGHWCPVCKDKTEKAVFECLKRAFGDEIVKHLGTRKYVPKDDDGTWAAFPYKFDIVVEHPSGEKTLTEVDGGQHFRDFGHWNSNARENQHRDLVKHIFALDRECHVVRIDQEWVARQIARGKTEWETRLIEAVRAQKCAFVCADGSNKYINHPCYWYGVATSLVLKKKKRRRFGVRVNRLKFSALGKNATHSPRSRARTRARHGR